MSEWHTGSVEKSHTWHECGSTATTQIGIGSRPGCPEPGWLCTDQAGQEGKPTVAACVFLTSVEVEAAAGPTFDIHDGNIVDTNRLIKGKAYGAQGLVTTH